MTFKESLDAVHAARVAYEASPTPEAAEEVETARAEFVAELARVSIGPTISTGGAATKIKELKEGRSMRSETEIWEALETLKADRWALLEKPNARMYQDRARSVQARIEELEWVLGGKTP